MVRYYEEIMFLLYFNDLNIITIKFLTHIVVPVAPLLRVQLPHLNACTIGVFPTTF